MDIKIRPLLLSIYGLLTFIVVIAVVWGGYESTRELEKAEWLAKSSRLTELSTRLSEDMAVERGLVNTILALKEIPPPEEVLSEIQKRRRTVNQAYKEIIALAKQLHLTTKEQSQLSDFSQLTKYYSAVKSLRKKVDIYIGGGVSTVTSKEWFDISSNFIEGVVSLRYWAWYSPEKTETILNYSPSSIEAIYRVSEYSGRERALLAAAIAQARSLSEQELSRLKNYHGIIEQGIKTISVNLKLYQKHHYAPLLDTVVANYEKEYLNKYRSLRQSIIRKSKDRQPYHLDAFAWFSASTRAIDSVLGLHEVTNSHVNNEIEKIVSSAKKHFIFMLVLTAIVMIGFIIGYISINRRIILPLGILKDSANQIAAGDLGSAITLQANDEFGGLGRAFEKMRKSLCENIAEQEKATRDLLMLSTAVEQSTNSIIVTDPEGIIEYVNPRFSRLTGYAPEEVIGDKAGIIRSGETSLATYRELWKTIKSGHVWQGELLNKKKNGELYWDWVTVSPVKEESGEIINFISFQHDITSRKQIEEKLDYQAYHDALTDLPNRFLFQDRLRHALKVAKRDVLPLIVIVIDVVRLGHINDALGYSGGDVILQAVAKRLKSTFRGSDTVARLDGDVFALVLPAINMQQVKTPLLKILQLFETPVVVEDISLEIDLAMGVSLYPDHGEEQGILLQRADIAMRSAKKGSVEYSIYDPEQDPQSLKQLKLLGELRQALEHKELQLHYQPQIDLATGKTVSVEALARWSHPEQGMIPPTDFIPMVEQSGLIKSFTLWVLQEAITQIRDWLNRGIDLRVGVNLSTRNLLDPDLPDLIAEILNEHDVSPEYLILEVTESAVMSRPEYAMKVLRRLHDMGIKLSVDDFGTGYSSFEYLTKMPVDVLKIDRSFILGMDSSEDDSMIVRSIIDLSQNLGLEVVAEGVEDNLTLTILSTLKCNIAQGYYLCRPVPVHELEIWLHKSAWGLRNKNSDLRENYSG